MFFGSFCHFFSMAGSTSNLTVACGSVPIVKKIVQIKNVKTVTLDRHNYFSWCTQFLTMLHDYELVDYIEGKIDLATSSTTSPKLDYIIEISNDSSSFLHTHIIGTGMVYSRENFLLELTIVYFMALSSTQHYKLRRGRNQLRSILEASAN